MLVLSRKVNEKLFIGDNIVINVVDIRGDKVRLGIEAPPDVAVHRQEVREAIERNGGAASSGKPVTSLAAICKEACQNKECPGIARNVTLNMFEITAVHHTKQQGVGHVAHATCVYCNMKQRFFIPDSEQQVQEDGYKLKEVTG